MAAFSYSRSSEQYTPSANLQTSHTPIDHYTTFVLQCHCQDCSIMAAVPTAATPLAISFCHCKTCRLVTGQLCSTVAKLPPGSKILRLQGSRTPKKYRASENGPDRFFCPTCGTSLHENRAGGVLYVDTGSMKQVRKEWGQLLLAAAEHIFVEDTRDGGLRDLMADLPAWEGWPDHSRKFQPGRQYGSKAAFADLGAVSKNGEKLKCRCHCRGVSFSISRPNEESRRAVMKQHIDLLVPWYEDEEKRQNKSNEPFWLRGDRYLAGLCVCSDCRTASGFEVQAWAFVPLVNIEIVQRATLVRYFSSQGQSYREFCQVCGATVFYGHEKAEGARECLDVSVGLMQSDSGARAEDWLEWHTDRVSYEDRADNAPFAKELSKGARQWTLLGKSQGFKAEG